MVDRFGIKRLILVVAVGADADAVDAGDAGWGQWDGGGGVRKRRVGGSEMLPAASYLFFQVFRQNLLVVVVVTRAPRRSTVQTAPSDVQRSVNAIEYDSVGQEENAIIIRST